MENERYIYGVGLVVVKGALVEYLLQELVTVVMAGAPEAKTKKALRGQFEEVARKLRHEAPRYLARDKALVDRINQVLDEGSRWMKQRNELAHSTWILDTDVPPGFDTRLHIRSGTEWFVEDKALESIADKLGLVSVKLTMLTTDILERRGSNAQEGP